ncbi:MAG: phosphotransferase family protein [Anaerolineales bacterium]
MMEITLTKPIAEGRTAEIYEWQDNTILKLYHAWCPSNWVEYESKVAHAVVEAGIPTPVAGEIVEVNGRRGLIFERVSGISMLQDMNARPWNLYKHARTMAELQFKINQLSFTGFMSYKDGLAHEIRKAPHLDDHTREQVLHILSSLQDGDRVCHGDFHPGNIMLTDKGAIVIDWITVRLGNPMTDFARTSMILTVGPKGAGDQINPIMMGFIKAFHKIYTRHYLHLMPDKHNERHKWLTVNAAARLSEQIEPERSDLIAIVEKGIRQ